MRARIKCKIITGNESSFYRKSFSTQEEDESYDRAKNLVTLQNIEEIKKVFRAMGFDFVTKSEAINGLETIRKCINKLREKDITLRDYETPNLIHCVLNNSLDSQNSECPSLSIDQIIELKRTTREFQKTIDDYVKKYLESLTQTLIDNLDLLKNERIIDEKATSDDISTKVRCFIAYLDALTLTEDMPDYIHEKELDSWVLAGYEDQGQVSFIVTLHNSTHMYIRIKANLFRKMQQACEIFLKKITKHESRILYGKRNDSILWKSQFIFLKIKNIFKKLLIGKKITHSFIRLSLSTPIEVMEPKREQPTIRGYIITPTLRHILKEYTTEILAIIFVLFFIFSTWPGTVVSSFVLSKIVLLNDQLSDNSMHAIMGRLNTGFIVAELITVVNLIIKIALDLRNSPIKWIFDSKPKC